MIPDATGKFDEYLNLLAVGPPARQASWTTVALRLKIVEKFRFDLFNHASLFHVRIQAHT
jgi:hypothetical protein